MTTEPKPHKRPSADRLQALRDYYLDNDYDWRDAEGDVADLFAEIDGLVEQLEAANARKDELWTRLLDIEGKYLDAAVDCPFCGASSEDIRDLIASGEAASTPASTPEVS